METAKIALEKDISDRIRLKWKHILGVQRCIEREPMAENSQI